jgi:type II restriction/modification system DNA methylase subunit YeeA
MRKHVEELLENRTPAPFTRDGRPRQSRPRWERDAESAFFGYLERVREVRVLDPACGSGNFLYVTLRLLKDLEKEAMLWGAEALRVTLPFPEVGPRNLRGIDINPYAAELARVSIWIGHIQWMLENGFAYERNPILKPLDNIECRDAILADDADGRPVPADWPDAEFIVGNPPFLGDKRMRRVLGDDFVDSLRTAWHDRVRGGADLVAYWHEKAREQIERGAARRAGLLATNTIRVGANRTVLQRILETGGIFTAWQNEPWVVEGAAVRVSIVGQDDGSERERYLDGQAVTVIHADLTSSESLDLTSAIPLAENAGASFIGDQKSGSFEISGELARSMLLSPINVNGRPNGDVIAPWINARDVVQRRRDIFIIDFGPYRTEAEAAAYERPFEYVRSHVFSARSAPRRGRHEWWLHERPRPDMREATAPLSRFIVTTRVSKHRLFTWVQAPTLPDSRLVVFAREDDYAFGVLHSRVHECWSIQTGGWHGVGNDPQYTPSVSFETFPFPWPLNTADRALTPEQAAHRDAIASAAQRLNESRARWLNPPELVREEPDVVPELPRRLVPVDEAAAIELQKRTLTSLYNARPAWLDNLHRDLDRAVFAAYAWPEPPEELPEAEVLGRLLALNQDRSR